MTPTSRVSENETTHGDTQAEDEGTPCEIFDRAVIESKVVLLHASRVGTSRSSSLRRDLRFRRSGLHLGHE